MLKNCQVVFVHTTYLHAKEEGIGNWISRGDRERTTPIKSKPNKMFIINDLLANVFLEAIIIKWTSKILSCRHPQPRRR